jgi:ABC-type sugar transport system permease subunit
MDLVGLAARAPAAQRRGFSYQTRLKLVGLLFVLPALAFFLVFFLYPVGQAVWVSFTTWNLFSPQIFVGLRNYINIFSDPLFLNALRVTVTFGFLTTAILCLVSMGLALLVDRSLRFINLSQTLYFLPSVLPLAVVAILWGYMLDNLGFVNDLLRSLVHAGMPFLTSSDVALYSIVFTQVWAAAGYFMVLFKAGLQAIPTTFYDAAKIDGAGGLQIIWHITLPLLRPTLFFVITLLLITTFQQFDLFYLMTSGGPGTSTQAVTFRIYLDAFFNLRMGWATAESMVLFVIMLVMTLIQARVFRTDFTYD